MAQGTRYTVSEANGAISMWQNTSGYGTIIINATAALLCEWNLMTGAPAEQYAKQMVLEASRTLEVDSRLLLLGAGCGNIAAGILCSASVPDDHLASVDAVDVSEQVLAMAASKFLPTIRASTNCARGVRLRERLRLLRGNALDLWHAPTYHQLRWPYTHILVDVPPIYSRGGAGVGAAFWGTLGSLSSGQGSHLVVNSWFRMSAFDGALRRDLLWSGWADVREMPSYDVDEHGRETFNSIVIAREWWPWFFVSRWTRWLHQRHGVRVSVLQLLVVVCFWALAAFSFSMLLACTAASWCVRCLEAIVRCTQRSRTGGTSRVQSMRPCDCCRRARVPQSTLRGRGLARQGRGGSNGSHAHEPAHTSSELEPLRYA